mgnify:FL=1
MYKHFFKRLFAFVIALCALPFVLLAIIIFGPIIYFTDRGPIFYNATRTGKGAKQFKMYKFRSMYVNSPDLRNADGSTFNSDNDPRVTPIGRFIRKTSVDEIPQLLNVLFGDMTFVGPRPTLGTDKKLEEMDAVRQKRYSVRPGITGYAQAYFRNSIGQDEKFKWDCYYVDNLSFMLDIKILWKIALSVVKHKNVFVENNTKK